MSRGVKRKNSLFFEESHLLNRMLHASFLILLLFFSATSGKYPAFFSVPVLQKSLERLYFVVSDDFAKKKYLT